MQDDAVKDGDLETVKALLKAQPDLISRTYKDGWTPVEFAAEFGHRDMVELLPANKADMNAKDNQGETPIYWAETKSKISRASPNVAEWLCPDGGHEQTAFCFKPVSIATPWLGFLPV